jgi:hypothetical protein
LTPARFIRDSCFVSFENFYTEESCEAFSKSPWPCDSLT